MDKILFIIKKLIPRKLFMIMQPAYHFLLSWFSAVIYSHPSNKLIVIGVTGTTGKTTCVYLIAKLLENSGFKVGFTSTAMFNDGKKEWLNDKKMTMMGRFFIQRILCNMVANGCQYAIVETTSEGVVQHRHRFINYDTLVFTGLYPEHIDSHGSFENYKQAKGKLFKHLSQCKTKYTNDNKQVVETNVGLKKIDLNRVKKSIIVNGDDEHKDYFLEFLAERKIMFKDVSLKKEESQESVEVLNYKKIKNDSGIAFFEVLKQKIKLQLLGDFNVANAMTAVSVALVEDIKVKQIKVGLEKVSSVPGRLEKIDEGQNFTVIIDYAYEPNAVAKLYETIKFVPCNKIIHVLGSAGGGRDIARRPILGKLAAENADFVIITNEDPYDDSPVIIIDQVALGAENAGKKLNKNLFKIIDRREAIKKALSLAQINDILIITGKGNEQAICVENGKKIKWDDRDVTRELLANIK